MTSAGTIREHVAIARRRLQAAGIDHTEAALDARLLAQETLGWDTARFIADDSAVAPADFETSFRRLVDRRERREPLAYILGRREFWGMTFEVNPSVLVPRPETELIVEIARDVALSEAVPRLADIGTGSGCLAVALASILPAARVVATDISDAALQVARRNADRNGTGSRVDFVQTSFLDSVEGTFNLIVSNPPYVPTIDRASLPPEVREYEPSSALFAGTDGLDVIRGLLKKASSRLAADGALVFEFGAGQAPDVTALIDRADGLDLVAMRADLQGIPRVALVARHSQR